MKLRTTGAFIVMALLGACGDTIAGSGTAADAGNAATPAVEPPAPRLATLQIAPGELTPAFDPMITEYTLTTSAALVRVAATAAAAEDSVVVNGSPRGAEGAFPPIPLVSAFGAKTSIDVRVAAPDGTASDYHVVVGTQSLYLKASNTGIGDKLGISLSLSGDTLAVGAFEEASGVAGDQADDSMPGSGAVYVFVRSGASWVQQAYLKASNPLHRAWFGTYLSLDRDTLAVSAYAEDDPTFGSGAVYVFVRDGSTWTEQARLLSPKPDYMGMFGMSLALSGDTLVVGMPHEDSAPGDPEGDSMTYSGAVFVFVRSGGSWTQRAMLKASNADAFDEFGTSVALDGPILAVGSPGESSAATGDAANNDMRASGAVYLFQEGDTGWVQTAFLKASAISAGNRFGVTVALDGDLLAVGATGADLASASGLVDDSGAVHVFARSAEGWREQAMLVQPVPGAYDSFGASLALRGEMLVVGAPGEDGSAAGIGGDQHFEDSFSSGAAYLFTRVDGTWVHQAYLKASTPARGEGFGFAVACDRSTVVVGAPGESSATTGVGGSEDNEDARASGAVYVF